MKHESPVARFIDERIKASGQLQKDIAEKAGFTSPNVMTMIKQGRTKLPLERVGPVARALEVDPVELLHMYFEEYSPAVWSAIKPYLQPVITDDERQLIAALRHRAGTARLEALSEASRAHLQNFLDSVRNFEVAAGKETQTCCR